MRTGRFCGSEGVGYLWSYVPSGGRVSLAPCPFWGAGRVNLREKDIPSPRRDMGPEIPYLEKEYGTRDNLPPTNDMGPGTRKGPGTRDTLPPVDRHAPVRTLHSRNFVVGWYKKCLNVLITFLSCFIIMTSLAWFLFILRYDSYEKIFHDRDTSLYPRNQPRLTRIALLARFGKPKQRLHFLHQIIDVNDHVRHSVVLMWLM